MKVFQYVFYLFFLSSAIFSQQKYYKFSELRGMEDASGSTHLFYRLFYDYKSSSTYKTENSVYHLDLSNNIDTLFLFDVGGWNSISDPSFTSVINYEFWNNDPSKFIYCGVNTVVDPVSFLKRFDQNNPPIWSYGEATNGNIKISKQNDSLIFASLSGNIICSRNGGKSWDTVSSSAGKQLISLSPFNDSILFAQENNMLFKSTDRGNSFFAVDTFLTDYKSFIYDKDQIHIYRTVYSNHQFYLLVSDDAGNAFSWIKRFSSEDKIFISIDPHQSGVIYLADGLNIYYSADFGANFNLYRTLNRNIAGIYVAKEDSVYAATKYDLLLIKQTLARTRDTLITIKHLAIDPQALSLFPLKVGNEWTYEKSVDMYKSRYKIKVIKDTIISGKQYFKLTNGYFRVDSLYGRIYQYISGDFVFYDFSAREIGDTVLFNQYNGYNEGWFLQDSTEFNKWGINSDEYQYSYIIPASGYKLSSFVKNVGLFKDEGGEVLNSSSVLTGFVKGGVVYGDTTLVGVNEEKNKNPAVFSLLQNYPNPFNPSTIIKYSIPKTSFVNLKIYDILGKEVAVLVNEVKPAGAHRVEFFATNGNRQLTGNNKLLTSGIYFYRLRTGDYIQTKKMIYLK